MGERNNKAKWTSDKNWSKNTGSGYLRLEDTVGVSDCSSQAPETHLISSSKSCPSTSPRTRQLFSPSDLDVDAQPEGGDCEMATPPPSVPFLRETPGRWPSPCFPPQASRVPAPPRPSRLQHHGQQTGPRTGLTPVTLQGSQLPL